MPPTSLAETHGRKGDDASRVGVMSHVKPLIGNMSQPVIKARRTQNCRAKMRCNEL